MYAVQCENISKVFKKGKVIALKDINFSIEKGEIFGIIGPNGSGKSTLIRILSTLLIPDSGRATIFGLDVVKDPLRIRRLINRVSVEAAFFKRLSAWENLRYAARLYGVSGREARFKSLEILETLGFDKKRIDEPLEELSRGMQQKVAIARALFTSPMLLLLDEPTTGLDPRSKKDLQNFILDIIKKSDLTILLTTHDMNEAEILCQRVAIIDKGKFVALDKPDQLKFKYRVQDLETVFMKTTGKEWEEEVYETE
ncbi:MAG: ABC transporter ATP-binding protein [candidate division WOR-3 bacterium]